MYSLLGYFQLIIENYKHCQDLAGCLTTHYKLHLMKVSSRRSYVTDYSQKKKKCAWKYLHHQNKISIKCWFFYFSIQVQLALSLKWTNAVTSLNQGKFAMKSTANPHWLSSFLTCQNVIHLSLFLKPLELTWSPHNQEFLVERSFVCSLRN